MANFDRIQILDGWRGMAVCLVLFGHFFPLPGSEIARLGVELFFVLSGRLMAQILITKKTALPIFFWRRFSRVLPALFVFVAVVGLLSTTGIFKPSALEYFSVLTMWSNYLFTFVPREPVFGHTWSLAIEEHSYIVLGLIALLTARKVKLSLLFSALIILIGFSRGLWLTFGEGLDFYDVYWRTDVRAASLFCGFFAYLYHHNYGLAAVKKLASSGSVSVSIVIMLIVIQFVSIVPNPLKYTIGTTMTAALLIAIEERAKDQAKADWVEKLLTHRYIIFMGVASYSVYLYQQIFHAIKADLSVFAAPLFLLPSIVVGWLSWRYVETPTRAFLNNVNLSVRKKVTR